MMPIHSRYLSRLAVVYIRQSTERQVRNNEGSREHQEGQIVYAREFGWRERDIVKIDRDLGHSGMDTKRLGFVQLLDMIKSDSVGGLFVSDVSRAGRDDEAWMNLLTLLAVHDVLLFENGAPMDPHDENQVFVKKIQALTVSRENRMRMLTVHRGRLAKARTGKAVSAPPAGYVAELESRDGNLVKTGRWIKDPNSAVREAVEAVFRAFREGRSLVQAVRLLKQWGIKLPTTRSEAHPKCGS